jgi:hypothetical protein
MKKFGLKVCVDTGNEIFISAQGLIRFLKLQEVISKIGFWFKVAADLFFL